MTRWRVAPAGSAVPFLVILDGFVFVRAPDWSESSSPSAKRQTLDAWIYLFPQKEARMVSISLGRTSHTAAKEDRCLHWRYSYTFAIIVRGFHSCCGQQAVHTSTRLWYREIPLSLISRLLWQRKKVPGRREELWVRTKNKRELSHLKIRLYPQRGLTRSF